MGPCAKRQVSCDIYLDDDIFPIIRAQNDCENPQAVCPREEGEGYEKCKTICRQSGHAEQQAAAQLNTMRASTSLKTFDGMLRKRRVSAVVQGHTYVCRECQEALHAAGVKWISVEHNMRERT